MTRLAVLSSGLGHEEGSRPAGSLLGPAGTLLGSPLWLAMLAGPQVRGCAVLVQIQIQVHDASRPKGLGFTVLYIS